MRNGMGCFRTSIGMGADKVNPIWWRDPPDGGLEDLCELLNVIEARQPWPSAMRLCVVQLLHKLGSVNRPFTSPGSVQTWGIVRRSSVADWSAERAAH